MFFYQSYWVSECQSFNTACDSYLPPRPSVDTLHSIIRSKAFWATVKATTELALQCEHLGRWSEGCYCHESLLTEWAATQDTNGELHRFDKTKTNVLCFPSFLLPIPSTWFRFGMGTVGVGFWRPWYASLNLKIEKGLGTFLPPVQYI